jgi:glucans biosynthesis protein C
MRYQYIDNLRALENLLRCCIHVMVPFMMIPNPIWPFRSIDGHSQIFDALVFLIHCQTMEVFFAINGFFAILLLSKNTTKHFIINRLYRIGVPFVLGLILLIPMVMSLGLSWRNHVSITAVCPFLIDYFSKNTWPLAHLWSLAYLFPMYAVFIFLIKKVNAIAFLAQITSSKILLFLGITAAVLLMCYHRRYSSAPTDVWFEWPMLLYFFAYFMLGVWFFIAKEKMQDAKPMRWLWLILILALAINLSYQIVDLAQFPILKFIGPMAYATQTICCLIYIWYGMKRLTWRPVFLQKFADSTYWIYWIELPLVMLSHWLFVNQLPPFVIVVITIVFIFAFGYWSFHLFLKNSVWGKSKIKIKD